MRATSVALLLAMVVVASCNTSNTNGAAATPTAVAAVIPTTVPTVVPTASPTATATPRTPVPRTGAEALADDDYELLRGLRVGLIANHTSVVDGVPLARLLAEHADIDLVALFAPEHGATGTAGAGDPIDDDRDAVLGVPVYSLYGETRTPTPESLVDLDVLVYDLQDVGTRFYTYISTMGLAMQAAAEAGIAFVVLERPNPQGRELAGFVRDDGHASFVSPYAVPISYGMTSGELARAIVGEQWLPGVGALDLTVVPLRATDRSLPATDTANWLAPSPALPTAGSARAYPGTGLFEATSVSEGRGTHAPFLTIGAPWLDGDALAATMNALDLAGVRFSATTFVPAQLPTLTAPPRFEGQELHGVLLTIGDALAYRSVETGVRLLVAVQEQATALGKGSIVERPDGFDRLAGTPRLRTMLETGDGADEIIDTWQSETERFTAIRDRYRLD